MKDNLTEYLTVTDFAEIADVTPTAVYSRIKNGSLDKFIKLDNGIKMVSSEALTLFKPRKHSKVENKSSVKFSELENTKNVENEVHKTLESTLGIFKEQLSVKDEQILKLNEQIVKLTEHSATEMIAKNTQIEELNKQIEKLNDHLTFSNNLVDQSQRLNAAEKMKTLVEDTQEPPKKQSFWGKLFSRSKT